MVVVMLVYQNIGIANYLMTLLHEPELLKAAVLSSGGVRVIPLLLSLSGLVAGIFSVHKGDKLGVFGILLNLLCMGGSFAPLYVFFM